MRHLSDTSNAGGADQAVKGDPDVRQQLADLHKTVAELSWLSK